MKTFVLIKTTLFVVMLFLTQKSLFAQLTCDDAEPIEYTGPDIQAVSTFSTVGVPNDNASALPLYCTTPVGTAGQHWYSLDHHAFLIVFMRRGKEASNCWLRTPI